LNKLLWPVPIYFLYVPFLIGQGTLYRLNPELANEFVMPALLTLQPVLLPFTAAAAVAYGFARKNWLRNALLAGMWAIAIECLFSLRLEPFAAVAKVDH
jgi:hypothetical protein